MTDQRHTVLIVDDDEGVRKVLGQWVERLGYQTRLADSAESAVGVLEDTPVDVALCDIRMPGADGIWLAGQIRDRFPEVAVVLATGLHEMDPGVTLRPGVVGYVVKPFSHTEIAAAIKTGLEWRRTQAEAPRGNLLHLIEGWDEQ